MYPQDFQLKTNHCLCRMGPWMGKALAQEILFKVQVAGLELGSTPDWAQYKHLETESPTNSANPWVVRVYLARWYWEYLLLHFWTGLHEKKNAYDKQCEEKDCIIKRWLFEIAWIPGKNNNLDHLESISSCWGIILSAYWEGSIVSVLLGTKTCVGFIKSPIHVTHHCLTSKQPKEFWLSSTTTFFVRVPIWWQVLVKLNNTI